MKNTHKLLGLVIITLITTSANSQPIPGLASTTTQSDPLQQRQHVDSLQRILMRDSLSLTDQVITQVLEARHNFDSVSRLIYQNAPNTSTSQQGIQVQALRRQTTEAIKELMGASAYDHYVRLIMGQ
jgi:hypothetical protein